jgi:formamidopyrimidine-DNA glycosylase
LPELPEVETVRRGLEPVLAGQAIVRADVRRPDLRWPFPPRLAARLTGARVEALRRRSKYLLADLDRGETLIVHLGMTGRVLVSGAQVGAFHHTHPAPEKHDHVVLDLDSGARLTFNDARRFGAIDLWPTADLGRHRLLADLGPEPLGNAFDAATLAARLAGRIAPVKAILLDQRVVAGLGNIYVCEALWRARI